MFLFAYSFKYLIICDFTHQNIEKNRNEAFTKAKKINKICNTLFFHFHDFKNLNVILGMLVRSVN